MNYCYDNDLVVGITDTQFGPDQDLNRAMFITFLYRMAGEPYVTGDTGFTDVPEGRYFTDAVRWGVQKGIISGMTNTQFAPFYPLNQEMVVTFLYRFARDIRGYTVETSNGLPSSVSSSVSNYAKVSMYWASRNGVVYLSDELAPKVTVTRGEAVRYLWRFGTNVDGLIIGTDTFSFVNDASSFTIKDHCGMTSQHYNKLYNIVPRDLMANVNEYINRQKQGELDYGLCYGMSVCAILDKMGKIDLNGNFCKNAATIYSIPKPCISSSKNIMGTERDSLKKIALTESVLSYYQVCQWLPTIVGYSGTGVDEAEYLYGRTSKNLENLHDEQENGGLGLFSYQYETNGTIQCHTIVVYGRPISVSEQLGGKYYYTYRVYDSRFPGKTGTLYVSKDFTVSKVKRADNGVYEDVTMVRYFVENEMFGENMNGPKLNDDNNFSTFDAVDIDGENNNGMNSASVAEEIMRERGEEILQEYAFFYVQADGPFTITNAEGESFTCEHSGITGDMAAKLVNIFPGAPGILLFRAPRSESFVFETQASSVDVSYVTYGDSKMFCGENVEKAVLERDSLVLSGNGMAYRASMTVNTEDALLVCVSGTGEASVLLFRTVDQPELQIQTAQATYVVEMRDFFAGVSIGTQIYQDGVMAAVQIADGSPVMTAKEEMLP